jgi:endonuclease YncB( thermonuclease family)
MKRLVLPVLLVLSLVPALPAQSPRTFTGEVVAVLDGDSLRVLRDGHEVEVRLHGADAPEGGQTNAAVCRRALSNLVFGRAVTVDVVDIDRYRRSVSRVSLDGQDVGLEMIRGGFAWHYTEYSNDARYAAAERDARAARRGLWQDPKPIAPWAYRAQKAGRTRDTAPPTGRHTVTTTAEPAPAGPWHGNVSSHVFHAPGCQQYDCKSCTAVFVSYDAAVAAGYRPHQECVRR